MFLLSEHDREERAHQAGAARREKAIKQALTSLAEITRPDASVCWEARRRRLEGAACGRDRHPAEPFPLGSFPFGYVFDVNSSGIGTGWTFTSTRVAVRWTPSGAVELTPPAGFFHAEGKIPRCARDDRPTTARRRSLPPIASVTSCGSTPTIDPIEQTTTSASGLYHDAAADQYIYVWPSLYAPSADEPYR
jgi:hypothetical protein